MASPKFPAIPHVRHGTPAEQRAFDAIRETLEVLTGTRGGARAVLVGDLLASGSHALARTGTGLVATAGGGGSADYAAAPPAVEGLTVTAGFSSVLLTWDTVRFAQLQHVEVLRQKIVPSVPATAPYTSHCITPAEAAELVAAPPGALADALTDLDDASAAYAVAKAALDALTPGAPGYAAAETAEAAAGASVVSARATLDAVRALLDFGGAVVGTTQSFAYSDAVDPGQRYLYWVRAVSSAGRSGPLSDPVLAETLHAAGNVLDELTAEANKSALTALILNGTDLSAGYGAGSTLGSVLGALKSAAQAAQATATNALATASTGLDGEFLASLQGALNSVTGRTLDAVMTSYDDFVVALRAQERVSAVQVVVAELESTAAQLTLLTAGQGDAIATLSQSLGVEISEREALSSLVNQTTAKLAGVSSTVSEYVQTAVTGGGAVDGEARALYGVRVEQTVGGDKYVSGFGLQQDLIDGAPSSQFLVQADRFAVLGKVGEDWTPARSPFTVADGQVYIDKAAIRAATIQELVAGSVVADFLRSNMAIQTAVLQTPVINVGTSTRVLDPGAPGGERWQYDPTTGRQGNFSVDAAGIMVAKQARLEDAEVSGDVVADEFIAKTGVKIGNGAVPAPGYQLFERTVSYATQIRDASGTYGHVVIPEFNAGVLQGQVAVRFRARATVQGYNNDYGWLNLPTDSFTAVCRYRKVGTSTWLTAASRHTSGRAEGYLEAEAASGLEFHGSGYSPDDDGGFMFVGMPGLGAWLVANGLVTAFQSGGYWTYAAAGQYERDFARGFIRWPGVRLPYSGGIRTPYSDTYIAQVGANPGQSPTHGVLDSLLYVRVSEFYRMHGILTAFDPAWETPGEPLPNTQVAWLTLEAGAAYEFWVDIVYTDPPVYPTYRRICMFDSTVSLYYLPA